MLGIAFEGCGCRAAFHVGVIEWLVEHDLMPEAVSGAISGALIAGAFAIGRAGDLRAVWTELFGSRVSGVRRLLSTPMK
jgi:predicted acylesterase/phospholipase RssA